MPVTEPSQNVNKSVQQFRLSLVIDGDDESAIRNRQRKRFGLGPVDRGYCGFWQEGDVEVAGREECIIGRVRWCISGQSWI